MQEPSHAETFRIIICLVDNHWSMEVVSALINTDIVVPTQSLVYAITPAYTRDAEGDTVQSIVH